MSLNTEGVNRSSFERMIILQKLLNMWTTDRKNSKYILLLFILYYETLEKTYGKFKLNLWFKNNERFIIYDILNKAESYPDINSELSTNYEGCKKLFKSLHS